MTAEEIEALKNQLEKQQRDNLAKNLVYEKMIKDYKANKLTIPEPCWHIRNEDVDTKLLSQAIDQRLLNDWISIIPNVNIEYLFDHMTDVDAAMFRRRKLYSNSFDGRKTSLIIDHWMKKKRLIPPTIMVYDREFAEALQKPNIIPSEELKPVDGKHRLNIAYCYGAKAIPILVRNRQLNLIKSILNI